MKNTNCARIFSLIFAAWIYVLPAPAQDSLRLMSYNLLMYPGGTDYSRESDLQYIAGSYMPDLLGVCEVQGYNDAADILENVLQPLSESYRMSPFIYNHSNPNDALQQLVYYNNDKLELIRTGYITTEIRDINHYTFRLRTPSSDTLDVYVMHLKASSSDDNEQKRWRMVRRLEASLDSLPPHRYVTVMGDFNLYSSQEPAWQEMTDTTRHIPLYDPTGREGHWHNSAEFADLHTQSTHRNNNYPYNNFVGGGLDDRFDFILLPSSILHADSTLTYRPGSYAAYGNNGNCFNKAINDAACSGRYSQTLRDHLYRMSDHIPVVLTLLSDQSFAVAPYERPAFTVYPNPARSEIGVKGLDTPGPWIILDATGQQVMHCRPQAQRCRIEKLKPGVYYLKISAAYAPVPFIKN